MVPPQPKIYFQQRCCLGFDGGEQRHQARDDQRRNLNGMLLVRLLLLSLFIDERATALPTITAFLAVPSRQRRPAQTRQNKSEIRVLQRVWEISDGGEEEAIHHHAAPVFITIGPPCCGKTEALRSHLFSQGYNPDDVFSPDVNVALDSASDDIYHSIPLAAYLFPRSQLDEKIGKCVLKSGSTIQERLLNPSGSQDRTDQEMRNIILRIAGRIPASDFAGKTRALAKLHAGQDKGKFFQKRRMKTADDLIAAVEQVAVQAVSEVICQMQLERDSVVDGDHQEELPYDDENEDDCKLDLSSVNMNVVTQAHLLSARALIKTEVVELFVPQSLFNGGIGRAENALDQLLRDGPASSPVTWGNTNTRPTEYLAALEAAEKSGRPVQFIAWGTKRLHPISRQDLLQRSISRFRKTGRYVPAGAIVAALGRTQTLVKEAQREADLLFEGGKVPPAFEENDEWEAHKMDVAFAKLAGFSMDDDGYVAQVGEPQKLGRTKQKYKSKSNPRRQKKK